MQSVQCEKGGKDADTHTKKTYRPSGLVNQKRETGSAEETVA